jgi:hypothetical protein
MIQPPEAQTKLDEIVKEYNIISDVPLPAFMGPCQSSIFKLQNNVQFSKNSEYIPL